MYNFIKLKINEKWKTVFIIQYKHYEYNVMLFKLTNTLTTC